MLFPGTITVVGQVDLTVSNLPIIVIETGGQEIADSTRIIADMGVIYNGEGQINRITDPFNHYDGKISIEIRGSTTQDFPKKSYGLETQYISGATKNVSLLGMPGENDWILYAPYCDKSLIRNIVSYRLSRELGHYATRTRLCELVIDGEYLGIYVLTEKIKRGSNRVDIDRLNPEEISGDDLSGGYIIKIDKQTGDSGPGWKTDQGEIYFQYDYPGWDEIVQVQKDYIKNYLDDFEEALLSGDFSDPELGYRKYLDEQSAIDMFIVNEITKNVDAYCLSYFLYKEKESDGGKLHMGPIWDFNLALGNADFREGFITSGFQVKINPSIWWWDRLLEDETFVDGIRDRWYTVREQTLDDDHIFAIIDSLAILLNEAQERNFIRWNVLGRRIWPNYFIGESFQEEMDYLRSWTSDRLHWLDQNLHLWNSTGENSISPATRIFPNPFRKNLRLDFTLDRPGTVILDLYNLNGMQLDRIIDQVYCQKGFHDVNWESNDLPPSVYMLVMCIDGEIAFIEKIVKL